MTATATFRRVLQGVGQGEVVIPVIRAALFDPKFRAFTVRMPDLSTRPPDGWFHPSTHPLWTERMLYLYLARPNDLVPEPLDPHSTMAITQGHFWHDFIQTVGIRTGLLRRPPKCPCGCKTKTEWYVEDPETRSRGHMDGLLAETGEHGVEVFEFKTMTGRRATKIARGLPHSGEVLDSWRTYFPNYYGQAQEYMRLSGYRAHRTLVQEMEYPYPMREIVTPYDPAWAAGVAQKYRNAIQAVADQRMPSSCCGDFVACAGRAVCKTW